jgi:hypothetical protein
MSLFAPLPWYVLRQADPLFQCYTGYHLPVAVLAWSSIALYVSMFVLQWIVFSWEV